MVQQIGLMDYDVLRTKYYVAPNYDLGLVYAYLKGDRNLNVRLISSPSPTNLAQYDKIYIFKQSKYIPHPSGYIQDYYKLPIEEYGPGFIDKPLRPFLTETRYMQPDFKCYNNMLLFSINKPRHKIAWKIDSKARGGRYQPIRLYEPFQGEDLKKDYPTSRYCMVYDDPVDILNNKEKWEYYSSLVDKGHIFLFAQSVDISLRNDTILVEQVMKGKKYSPFRKRLIASEINDNVKWLVHKVMSKELGKISTILVKLPVSESPEVCLETMLLMNYYNHKSNFKINLRPMWEKGYLENHDLALLAYRYLAEKPYYMSYYEYVFNISYLRKGVQKELIHTGEDRYEFIFQQYGMSPLLKLLEDWIRHHPQYEEHVFIGGSSNYGEQRRKYYDAGRGQIAFRTSAYDSSQKCSS